MHLPTARQQRCRRFGTATYRSGQGLSPSTKSNLPDRSLHRVPTPFQGPARLVFIWAYPNGCSLHLVKPSRLIFPIGFPRPLKDQPSRFVLFTYSWEGFTPSELCLPARLIGGARLAALQAYAAQASGKAYLSSVISLCAAKSTNAYPPNC